MKVKWLKVIQTLTKTVKVVTESTVDSDTIKDTFEREHWDIKSLLNVLEEYVKLDLSNKITDRRTQQLEVIAMACRNWNELDYIVEEDEIT